jgi:hypothetical protein
MFETSNQSNIWGLCESSHIKGDAFDWVSDSSCFILVAYITVIFVCLAYPRISGKQK